MVRVASFRAKMAKEVLEMAKDANDTLVITACRRVREAWLLGRKVSRADLDLIEAVAQ